MPNKDISSRAWIRMPKGFEIFDCIILKRDDIFRLNSLRTYRHA